MVLYLPSFPVLFTLLVLLFSVVIRYRKKSMTRGGRIPKLPPGPPKLPLIGNLHQLAAAALPHRALRDLAEKHGPIMHLKLGEVSGIVISTPEAAEEVLKKHELSFAQRPKLVAVDTAGYGYSGIFFSPYGDYWRHLRKIVTLELLSTKQVRSFWSVRVEETWNLVDSIASSSGASINLTEKLLHFTNAIISRAAFGDKCKDVKDFISVVREGSELCGGFDMPDLFPSLPFLPLVTRMKPAVLENLKVRMDKVLDSIINDHLAKSAAGDESGDDDLIDVLLKLRDSDDCPLTMTNIKAIILDIFAGGTDNSSATLEWAMSEMLRNPKVMAKAQAEVRQALKGKKKITEEDVHELHYLKLVIKETLRLHPPAPLLPREVREECQINGYDMPIKAKVIVNLWAIGRNKRQWPDADSFRPERFQGSSVTFQGTNFEYIPFGAGRRICPGIQFATASIELSLALLLNQFDWNLPDGIKPEESDMTERFGISVRKKNPLYVTPIPVSSFD
ncbi:hypothetical protein RJ639_043600 [Escallonia herrerae]|uniref:Cytochrome P450 n=1 Tax=Escallonia herrerae TaxID=1293975 RepID=A0AA88WJW0_9ASTE|nr:hypothetical protein RJ639_043600 [Escallonia herrerae]